MRVDDVHVGACFPRQVVDLLGGDSLVEPLNHSVGDHIQVQVTSFQPETQSFQTFFNWVYLDSLFAAITFCAELHFWVLFYLFCVFESSGVKWFHFVI
jgi:hypothetical protein